MKMHITSACSRQRTRCPFVCMLAGSHFRTQMANTCTAADAGVRIKSTSCEVRAVIVNCQLNLKP